MQSMQCNIRDAIYEQQHMQSNLRGGPKNMNPCIFIQMIFAWVFSSWAEANGGNIWSGPAAENLVFV